MSFNLAERAAGRSDSGVFRVGGDLSVPMVAQTTGLGLLGVVGVGVLSWWLAVVNLGLAVFASVAAGVALLVFWVLFYFKADVGNGRWFFGGFVFLEGVILGVLCRGVSLEVFKGVSGGMVVFGALFATVVTFGVLLVLHSRGLVVVAPGSRLYAALRVALPVFLLMYVCAFVFNVVTGSSLLWGSGLFVQLFAVAAIFVACLSLLNDFWVVEQAVLDGAPVESRWLLATGLLSGLVWLFVEFLRLFVSLVKR